MAESEGYLVSREKAETWDRIARKVDGARGPGVSNKPESLTINQPATAKSVSPPGGGTDPHFWVEITSTYDATTGYDWTEQDSDSVNGLENKTGGRTGDYLFDPNGQESYATGLKVLIRPNGTDGSGNQLYLIVGEYIPPATAEYQVLIAIDDGKGNLIWTPDYVRAANA